MGTTIKEEFAAVRAEIRIALDVKVERTRP
jgi:hypothetical protein